MKTYNHKKSFIFHNKAEGLASVVRSCVEYIEEQNEFLGVPIAMHSKIKWAITELLINGAKHSGSEKSRLNLIFTETSLTIEKEDYGNPLGLKVDEGTRRLQWPLPENVLNQQFEVYRNGMDSLRVYTEDEKSAFFIVEEMEDEEMPLLLVNTSEHFGLMIIAKASSRFTYAFESKTGKNIFSIQFDYSG
ncbi:anti-sigma regulatory factor [Dyadobacter subterraneus]|uniref:Anti-sigma regulatory factor n=1 Tax=Dyadobacter subterraneus TaxID=2773304 RepID=A0ABR9WCB9_9BACT|nr:anti-sigma regulatory factor [Dyadobacter subterraneus]MBE9463121.1 anti-sigma regulatory factor [Dyadobacter subterraneus]